VKATLEFQLPEEEEDFEMSSRALRLVLGLQGFVRWLKEAEEVSDRSVTASEVVQQFRCSIPPEFVHYIDV